MLWICWLVSCLNWGQCCEATREFILGSFITSYLPNSGRDWLNLIAVWRPSHFGAAKSNTSTCFMHKHINRATQAAASTHTHTIPYTVIWMMKTQTQESKGGRDEMSVCCHRPWACLMARHAQILKSTHIHAVLAQISKKMAPLIELISIFGQRDIYTPL